MNVYFFSKNLNLAYLISSELEKRNFSCTPFTKQEVIVEAIYKTKYLPDIILMDYTVFNHNFFNIYNLIKKKGIFLPILFYNDPCLYSEDYILNWQIHLEQIYQMYLSDDIKNSRNFVKQYDSLLEALHELLIVKGLKEYIPCMQKPKEFPSCYSIQNRLDNPFTDNKDITEVKQLIKKIKLKQNLAFLLEFLYVNKNTPVSYRKIKMHYEDNNMEIKESSLPVLISKLRKELQKESDCNISITKNKDGYTLFII